MRPLLSTDPAPRSVPVKSDVNRGRVQTGDRVKCSFASAAKIR